MCGTVVGDGGNYSCTASTPERQDRAQFLVNVIGVPPTLIQTPGIDTESHCTIIFLLHRHWL